MVHNLNPSFNPWCPYNFYFFITIHLPTRLLEKFNLFTVYLRFLKEIVTDSLLGNGLSVSICVWYWVLLFPLLLSFNTSWTSSVLLVDAISLQQRIAEVDSIIDRLAIFYRTWFCSLRFKSQTDCSLLAHWFVVTHLRNWECSSDHKTVLYMSYYFFFLHFFLLTGCLYIHFNTYPLRVYLIPRALNY